MHYVTGSAASKRPWKTLERVATLVVVAYCLMLATACSVPEPLTRTETVTVVETKMVGVPAELTATRDWPWYPTDRRLTYGETVILAEEYKDRWIGCKADKARIRDLAPEPEDEQ